MLNEFFVDLISNASMDIFPDNSISKFINRLPQTLYLEGNWEVAVNEIFYPLSHKPQKRNIEFKLTFSDPNRVHHDKYEFVYSEGDSIEEIITRFNISLAEAYRHDTDIDDPDHFRPPKLTLDETNEKNSRGEPKKKITFHAGFIKRKDKDKPVWPLIFDHTFIRLLGFDFQLFKKDLMKIQKGKVAEIIASNTPDLGPKSHLMFIYTDIINEHFVGDTSARVLRVIPLDKSISENLGHMSFTTPYYYPVRMNKIEDISIMLCDETGNQIRFKSGRVYLSLHFKKSV